MTLPTTLIPDRAMAHSLLSLAMAAAACGAGESLPTSVLRPSPGPGWQNEWFSVDLELTENLLVVGSDQGGSYDPGTVHVYRRSGSTLGLEQVIAHQGLSNPGGFPANRVFGYDVAVADDERHIFVGAPSDAGTEHGAVFIYEHKGAAGWMPTDKLIAPDGATLDWFGGTVEVSGDNLAVAAYRTDDLGFDTGSVYMFRRQPDGGWLQVAKLTIPDAREHDLFGNILAIQGDLLVVSSVTADLNDNSAQGAVYTFVRDDVDGSWQLEGRLAAPDGSPSDFFGSALATYGDVLAVGAYGRSVPSRDGFRPGQGSVYLYRRDRASPSGWRFLQLIKSADVPAGGSFGRSVAFDGDILVVGAAPWQGLGAAYAFRRGANGIADNWSQVHKFTYNGDSTRPYFGDDVVISPHVVVIGARDDGDVAWKDGAAFVFDRDFDASVPPNHYDQWRGTHFSSDALQDPSQRDLLWGDNADPDGDAIPNLAEYFAGSLPTVADPAAAIPAAAFHDGALTWTYPVSDDPEVRAVASVQSDAGPGAWERFPQADQVHENGTGQLTITDSHANGAKRLFRMTIEEE